MNVLHYLGQAVRTAHGLKRYALAGGLGLSAALGLPPFFFIILLVPALSVLLLQISSSRSKKEAFAVGWWFGFGYFFAGLYWIAIALLVDPDQFAWLIPFATFGIAGVVALYIGFTALLTYLLPIAGFRRVLGFSMLWVAAEWLRAHLFTGFPWNLIGYGWSFSDSMIQLASVTGIYGLSLLTVLMAAMPSLLLERNDHTHRAWRPVVIALLLGLVVWAGGYARLQSAPQEDASGERIRIVQANIPQNIKWAPDLMYHAIEQHIDLSKSPSPLPSQIIVWPESAIPYYLNHQPDILAAVSSVIPKEGFLIAGSLRAEETPTSRQIWNSLYVIDSKGEIADIYDKVHLVPFGEYIPLRAILPITKITAGTIDFSSGEALRTLSAQGRIPAVSPLICYEGIFPGKVALDASYPAWLVNVTNDAWFGISTGPYQHFYMVRLRAVEQGVPLVRAANTGISAIIDSYGRVKALLGLGEKGVLDGHLPPPIAKTLYSEYGDALLAGIFGLLTLIMVLEALFSRKNK